MLYQAKKKAHVLQESIAGKFIPRSSSALAAAYPPGATDNRYNAKIAQLLASSPSPSSLIDEQELASQRSSQENSELCSTEASCIHSKMFHRRIVTMIETLRKPTQDPSATPVPSPHSEQKFRPITFGQLRQATLTPASVTLVEENSVRQLSNIHSDNEVDAPPFASSVKAPTKKQPTEERLYYSPSLEKLFEEQNVSLRLDSEAIDGTLAVDSLSRKAQGSAQRTVSFPVAPSAETGFFMQSSTPRWSATPSNQPPAAPSPLLINQQNQNRPPPPPYSSCVAAALATNRSPGVTLSSSPPTIFTPRSPSSSAIIPLSPNNTFSYTPTRSSVSSLSSLINPANTADVRPPPPRYQPPTLNTDHLQPVASLPPAGNSSTATQQSKPVSPKSSNQVLPGFDREFSRLLYGKDVTKARRTRQRRKAFSDPVKECVEEARRTFNKSRRRVTTHLNKPDSADDDDGDDETVPNRKLELNLPPRRRNHRQAEYTGRNILVAKKTPVPDNALLKERIPPFLRVYSQASPSTDSLLQWHLFNLPELNSLCAMMTRLYKNENLARVQLYEIYRSALLSALAAKTPADTDDEKIAPNAAR